MIRAKTLVTAMALSALMLGPLAPISFEFGVAPAFAKGNGSGNGGGNGGGKGGNAGGRADNGKAKAGGKAKGAGDVAKASAATAVTTTTDTASIVEPVEPAPNAHGKMASELKGLNAFHASETAFANASPNSQVGRIAVYREAALGTIAAGDAAEEAAAALEQAAAALSASEQAQADLDQNYSGRTTAEIAADMAALDPAAAEYQSSLDALNAERTAAETYEAERAVLETEIAANEAAVTAAEGAVTEAETALADAELAEGDALATAANGRTLSDPAIDFLREQLGL